MSLGETRFFAKITRNDEHLIIPTVVSTEDRKPCKKADHGLDQCIEEIARRNCVNSSCNDRRKLEDRDSQFICSYVCSELTRNYSRPQCRPYQVVRQALSYYRRDYPMRESPPKSHRQIWGYAEESSVSLQGYHCPLTELLL